MKLKKHLVLIISLLIVMTACLSVSAEENDVPLGFTIELADGTVNEYDMTADFVQAVNAAPDGSLATLAADMYVAGRMVVSGTESAPKSITIDLAGHGIYATSKSVVATMFGAGSYGTLNITSSKPDAFLYMIDEDTNSTQGGNIFAVNGVGALVNFGAAVSVKDVVYPGSNISTFSSCFVDVRGEGTIGFNCDGGQHFANIADWKGFINPRSGDGVVTVKNADILVDRNNTLIHSEDAATSLYMENCLIYRLDGTAKYLFNEVHADITFKDCVTNYSLVAEGASSEGIVTLEGNNIFGAGIGFEASLLKNGEGKMAARTNVDCTLVQGGVDYWRYDNSGMFNKLEESLASFGDAYAIVTLEETFECRWEYDDGEKSERWVIGSKPTSPFEILPSGKEGMYKKGWLKVRDNEEGVTFKATYITDFDIKLQCEYTGNSIFYHIYVPAFIIDDGYISFAEGTIDGAGFTGRDWLQKIIDGELYYEYVTMDIEEENVDKVIEIFIPCDFVDGSKRIKAEGVWRINLSEYLDIVYANSEKYTEEQMLLVEELKNRYFPSPDLE